MVVDCIEYVLVTQESKHEISSLFEELKTEGIETQKLRNWRELGLRAILLSTESGARYIVEPRVEDPSLVTRISEKPIVYVDGEHTPDILDVIVRREVVPDYNLAVGERVVFDGIDLGGQSYDMHSALTTITLVEIRYLPEG